MPPIAVYTDSFHTNCKPSQSDHFNPNHLFKWTLFCQTASHQPNKPICNVKQTLNAFALLFSKVTVALTKPILKSLKVVSDMKSSCI